MRATVLLFCCGIGCWCGGANAADPPQPTTQDKTALRRNVERYVQAFDRKDAKALAMLWAPEAVYVNPDTGKRAQGREAIQAEFKSQFENSGPEKLRVRVRSIRFVTPDVAVEDGTASVISADEEPSESSYTAVHVKQGDQWLLDTVRETVLPPPAGGAEHLKQLAWLEGEWTDEDPSATLHSTYRWTANQAFLTHAFTLNAGDQLALEGTQVIGWDPVAKQIRSWAFDSAGGFAEAVWQPEGDRWIIRSKSTLADGKTGSAINVLSRVDDDHCTWKSTARQIDGEMLPNVEEIEVVRHDASPQVEELAQDDPDEVLNASSFDEEEE